jgi:hypothetical protein
VVGVNCLAILKGVVTNASSYLYYKERTQLKAFLTQIGSVLPLTSDPRHIFLEVDRVVGDSPEGPLKQLGESRLKSAKEPK